jgi:hypothetical protein
MHSRVTILVETAETADFVNPRQHVAVSTAEGDIARIRDVILAEVAGTAYTVACPTTAAVLIENLDETNFVTVLYRTGAGAAVDQAVDIQPGEAILVVDFDSATDIAFTADTADVLVAVSYIGDV